MWPIKEYSVQNISYLGHGLLPWQVDENLKLNDNDVFISNIIFNYRKANIYLMYSNTFEVNQNDSKLLHSKYEGPTLISFVRCIKVNA